MWYFVGQGSVYWITWISNLKLILWYPTPQLQASSFAFSTSLWKVLLKAYYPLLNLIFHLWIINFLHLLPASIEPKRRDNKVKLCLATMLLPSLDSNLGCLCPPFGKFDCVCVSDCHLKQTLWSPCVKGRECLACGLVVLASLNDWLGIAWNQHSVKPTCEFNCWITLCSICSEAPGSEFDLGELLVLHELMKCLLKQGKPNACNPPFSNSSPQSSPVFIHVSLHQLLTNIRRRHIDIKEGKVSLGIHLYQKVCVLADCLHVRAYLQSWERVCTIQSAFKPLPVLYEYIVILFQDYPRTAPE